MSNPKVRIQPGDGDPRHGTEGGYCNHRCRCDLCCATWRARCADRQARRVSRGLAAGDPRHGTENAYTNYGCRCRPCTHARAARQRDLRARSR